MSLRRATGNDNRDACSNSPAAAEKAVTVGASTLGDERAYFSNFGKCVDVFAPGKFNAFWDNAAAKAIAAAVEVFDSTQHTLSASIHKFIYPKNYGGFKIHIYINIFNRT